MLSPLEELQLESIQKVLRMFNSSSKRNQSDKIDLYQVRIPLTLAEFPNLEYYVALGSYSISITPVLSEPYQTILMIQRAQKKRRLSVHLITLRGNPWDWCKNLKFLQNR